MANKKLSATTAITSLDGTEEIYVIVNTGTEGSPVWVEKRVALADILFMEMCFFVGGEMADGELLFGHIASIPFQLPASLTGSRIKAQTAAFGSTTLTIKKNGASIGTLVFAASGTEPTVTFPAAIDFVVGDVLTVHAPAIVDATLADVSYSLKAVRN